MPNSKQNLQAHRGETFTLNLTYNNPDGSPADLTGHNVVLVLLNKSTKFLDSEYVGTIDGNKINVKIQDEQTNFLKERSYLYRVEDQQPNGDIYWLLYGTLSVSYGDERD
jgi:hypothetical protein